MEKFSNILFDEEISIGHLPLRFVRFIPADLNHEGKSNHAVSVSFKVLDSGSKITFHYLNAQDFENYALQIQPPQHDLVPRNYQYKTETSELNNHVFDINKTSRVYFLFSKFGVSKIRIHITIKEIWEQIESSVMVLVGLSILNNPLSKNIRAMIRESKSSLRIISPHTDLHLIDELSSAIEKGVKVQLIVRNDEQQNSQATKQAFPHLQELLKDNLKSHNRLHARLIIRDDSEAIVMSSDLEQNSMQNLINCGIYVSNPNSIIELNNFFQEIWNSSKNTSKKSK